MSRGNKIYGSRSDRGDVKLLSLPGILKNPALLAIKGASRSCAAGLKGRAIRTSGGIKASDRKLGSRERGNFCIVQLAA